MVSHVTTKEYSHISYMVFSIHSFRILKTLLILFIGNHIQIFVFLKGTRKYVLINITIVTNSIL